MIKYYKFAATILTCFLLNGCFEVEDDSNDEVVAALQAQNAILQQQANTAPVSIFGTIVDAGSDSPVADANITVKVGTEWQPMMTVNSEFTIDSLPGNTDILILVQSPSGEFMDRAFYAKTPSVDQGQSAVQSIGDLKVSQGIEKSYSVINAETGLPFEGLVFNYNTSTTANSGARASGSIDYQVESEYDLDTGLYTITIPEYLDTYVTASGDIDGDDVVDFVTENNNFWYGGELRMSTYQALQLETLYVNETEAYQPVELRLTVIDDLGSSIEGIEFFASNLYLGRIDTTYDVNTQEYVLNYQTSSRVDLNMPSFTSADGVDYQSATISLNWATASTLSISGYGFNNGLPHQLNVVDGVASLVVQPHIAYTGYNYVSRVSSNIDNGNNFSLNQFYQSPIGLIEDSVTLVQTNVFTVIKGNESPNDLVADGTTEYGNITQEIAVTASLTHNDTFLVAAPDNALSAGNFMYRVNQLVNAQTGIGFNANYTRHFSIEPAASDFGSFDINDVKLDNNNSTTNGLIIVAQNTAGVPATTSNNNSNAWLILPQSARSLEYLEFNLISYVRNGVTQTANGRIRVVENGNIIQNEYNLLSLAVNENIRPIGNYYNANVLTKTSLADGKMYAAYSGMYGSDNTATNENTATFNYLYQVAGETTVHQGTITLPVL